MTQLSMSGQHLLAGRVIVATITADAKYRALVARGERPAVAAALVAGLITIKTA